LSVLLDTHVWVWWLTPDSPLSIAERSALDAKAGRGELFLAAVSLWEVQMLAAKRRPSDQDIDAALDGNICRCGTYQRIRRAIHRAARMMGAEA